MFCDLSASSSLFDVLHESGAIICINDYLSQVADIVLTAGGSVDQYLGDGAMFRFVPEAGMDPSTVARNAAEAAVKSEAAFQSIKKSWLSNRWEVAAVFTRVGISYGEFRETLIGPARYRERIVIGSGVHRAAELCDTADRKKNVIVVDARLAALLGKDWILTEQPDKNVFELIGKR